MRWEAGERARGPLALLVASSTLQQPQQIQAAAADSTFPLLSDDAPRGSSPQPPTPRPRSHPPEVWSQQNFPPEPAHVRTCASPSRDALQQRRRRRSAKKTPGNESIRAGSAEMLPTGSRYIPARAHALHSDGAAGHRQEKLTWKETETFSLQLIRGFRKSELVFWSGGSSPSGSGKFHVWQELKALQGLRKNFL